MNNSRQIIRKLVEEVIEEMTTTGAVSIPLTKGWVGNKGKDIGLKSMPGAKLGKQQKNKDDTTVGESENESLPTVRRDMNIMEARSRYKNFRESDMMRNEAKINLAIREAKNMMKEINFLLNISERLKTECGIKNEQMLKRTAPNLMEIHRQLKEITRRINRIGKS